MKLYNLRVMCATEILAKAKDAYTGPKADDHVKRAAEAKAENEKRKELFPTDKDVEKQKQEEASDKEDDDNDEDDDYGKSMSAHILVLGKSRVVEGTIKKKNGKRYIKTAKGWRIYKK